MKLNVLRNEYFFFTFRFSNPPSNPPSKSFFAPSQPPPFKPHSTAIHSPIEHPIKRPTNLPEIPFTAIYNPHLAHISPFHHPHVNHPPFKPFKIPSPCNPNVTQCKRFVFPPPSTHIPPNSLISRFLLPFPLSSSLSHFVFTPLNLWFSFYTQSQPNILKG